MSKRLPDSSLKCICGKCRTCQSRQYRRKLQPSVTLSVTEWSKQRLLKLKEIWDASQNERSFHGLLREPLEGGLGAGADGDGDGGAG